MHSVGYFIGFEAETQLREIPAETLISRLSLRDIMSPPKYFRFGDFDIVDRFRQP